MKLLFTLLLLLFVNLSASAQTNGVGGAINPIIFSTNSTSSSSTSSGPFEYTGTFPAGSEWDVQPSTGMLLSGVYHSVANVLTCPTISSSLSSLRLITIGGISGSFIHSLPNITNITFGRVAYVGGSISPSATDSLLTFTADNLLYAGGGLDLPDNLLGNLTLPSLQYLGGLNPRGSALTNISLASLATLGSGITFSENNLLRTLSIPLVTNLESFSGTAPALTNLVLTSLVTLGDFTPTLDAMQHLSFPALKRITGEMVPVTTNLHSFSAPVLTNTTDTFTLVSDVLTNVNLSAMVNFGNGATITAPTLRSLVMTNLLTSAFSNLQLDSVTNLNITNIYEGDISITTTNLPFVNLQGLTNANVTLSCNNTTSVNLSNVLSIGSLEIVSTTLTTVNLPSLVFFGALSFSDGSTPELTTISIGSGVNTGEADVIAIGCKLNVTSVNNLLVRLAALDGTGGTLSYDNHTIDLSGGTSAAPTGAGAAAVTTLEGRGNTVTVNP